MLSQTGYYLGNSNDKTEYIYDFSSFMSNFIHPFNDKTGFDYFIVDFPYVNKLLSTNGFIFNSLTNSFEINNKTTYNYDNAIVLSNEQFEIENKKIIAFPNPAKSYIEISGLDKSENYKIYTVSGIEVDKGTVSDNEKIDIQKLEKQISKELKREELEDCIKSFRGNVLQQLFKLQPKKSKRQYINKKFKLIKDYELEYNSINKDLLFKVECPFCQLNYNVSLNNNYAKATKLEDVFEFRNIQNIERIVFKCNHINSDYENLNLKFSFEPKFILNEHNEHNKYNYALLQYFFQFKIEKDNTISFFDSLKTKANMTIKDLKKAMVSLNGK